MLGDEFIGWHQEVVRLTEQAHLTMRWTQVELVDVVGDRVDGIDIATQALALMGEHSRQRTDKPLATSRDGIVGIVLGKVECIGAMLVDIAQLHLVEDTQVVADATDVATRLHAANDVHACVEPLAPAREGL